MSKLVADGKKITKEDIEYARRQTIQQCITKLDLEKSVKIGEFELSSDSKIIIDTPFRDNSIWAGDLFSAGPSAVKYVKGGIDAWRNSLLAIAYKQYPNGKLPACVTPALQYRFLSPYFDTYAMFWIVSAYEYLQRTNDTDFKKLFVTVFKKALGYFANGVTGDGLYTTPQIDMYWNWTIFRKKKSTHANALFYKVLTIAEEFGLKGRITSDELKENFNRYFWNDIMYEDVGNVTYLDGNSLALLFNMVPSDRKRVLLESLKYYETSNGPISYKGDPFALVPWHKEIICPFLSYIHTRALINVGENERARRVMIATLTSGLSVARKYGKETIPEFWKANGTLGARPIMGKRRLIGLSLDADWSTFGDLSLI